MSQPHSLHFTFDPQIDLCGYLPVAFWSLNHHKPLDYGQPTEALTTKSVSIGAVGH
jgi:hypothetical protein